MIYFFIIAGVALGASLKAFVDGFSWAFVPITAIGTFAVLYILSVLLFFGSFIFVNTEKPQKKNAKITRFFIKQLLPVTLAFARIKINAEGVEKVPKNTKLFFVCNHQYDLDPVIFYRLFPSNTISFIGKKEIYTQMPYIGKVMHKLGCLPIDRENNRAAVKTIIDAVKILKENRASVALFPEGYTSKSCELLPFRNGAFKIAYKANVPIAVCVLNNTRSIPKNIFRRKTEIDFKVLKVLYPEQYSQMSTVELGDMLHKQMEPVLNEMRKKA